MASLGHSGSHTSQLMHSSVIIRAIAALPSSWVEFLEFCLQPGFYRRLNKLADVPAQPGDFPDHGSGNKHVLLPGGKKHGFHLRVKIPVHPGHLEFVLEIGHRPQAPKDHLGALLVQEIHEQVGKTHHFHVFQGAQHLPGHGHPLLHGEEGALALAIGHRHDDPVKEPGGPAHQILMPLG